MMLLLNWRIWAALVVAVVLAGTHWKAFHMGMTTVQAKWDADLLQALEDDKKTTSQRIASNAKVDQKFQIEKQQLQAHIADANLALDSLRDTLSAQQNNNPPASCRIDAGGAERELLGQCATTLVRVAQEADRVEGKLNGLQDYIKQVVKP